VTAVRAIEAVPPTGPWTDRLRARVRLAGSVTVLVVGALAMVAAALPTLGLARRFYSEVIAAAIGNAILRLWGLRWQLHGGPLPSLKRQVVYVSNHSSTIDTFLLIALALPRTRFFLSGFLRRVIPIAIIGSLIRIVWTVAQDYPDQRRRIFARADRTLRRTGDSVYLSPEGQRITTGDIGHFNKGAFHLAASLGAPIVPLYIHIPPDCDPGRGYAARPGTIQVHVLPAIDTSQWRTEDAALHASDIEHRYRAVHHAVRNGAAPITAVTW
jgi:1-acyl-sn-glycerol-3-phosphate acyltransferase